MKSRKPKSTSQLINFINPDLILKDPALTEELDTILYADHQKTTQLAMHALFSRNNADNVWNKFWENKATQVTQYLQKLAESSRLNNQSLYDLAVSLQSFINSRSYEVTGRYEKSEMLGIALVKSTPQFRQFDNALTTLIQKLKPQAANNSWLPNFSGLLNSITQNLTATKMGALTAIAFVASCQAAAAQTENNSTYAITPTPIPTDELVAYFPFNGNLRDESGNDHDAIPYGITFITDRFNQSNSAIYFTNGAYIKGDTGGDKPFPEGDRTISLWYKPRIYDYAPGLNQGGYLFGYGGNGCDNTHGTSLIAVINNLDTLPCNYDLQSHCRNDRVLYYNATMNSATSMWNHWAMTSSGSTMKMYLNGQLVGTNFNAHLKTYVQGTEFAFGVGVSPNTGKAPFTYSSAAFEGGMDSIRVYNRALEDDEILALYNESAKTPDITPSENDEPSVLDQYLKPIPALAYAAATLVSMLGVGYLLFRKIPDAVHPDSIDVDEPVNNNPVNYSSGNVVPRAGGNDFRQ